MVNGPPVEIHQVAVNLSGDLTEYQGMFKATYMKWPALGVSVLHSLQKMAPK